jgi:hypothetical protein
MHVRGCLRLPGSSDKPLAFDTWRRTLRLFAKTLGLFGQAMIERESLFETAS